MVDKERHSKWVYYKITNKGKKVLENLETLILIMGSVFALIGLWIYYIFKQIKYQAREVVLSKTVVERGIYTTYKGSTTFQKEPLFLIFLIISTFLIIFIVYLVYKIIRR
ncbi:hypothetical protein [Methanocaldococcus vulcanius]|uniref:hypothetical protein n=1 Tax=Methanocaldococcus vulcanius TaxID=73913 RepID=UPI001FE07554|nr:hypothetical protein [Methanocaldococcus vulcanius]